MRNLFTAEYEQSKRLETIPNLTSLDIKLKNAVINDTVCTPKRRMLLAQKISKAVCSKLKIPEIKIWVRDSPQLYRNFAGSSKTKTKTLGRCWLGGNIEIWNLTAKREKVVSSKVFYHTLLHELCHHIDFAALGIQTSPHTSGFYKRIAYLDSCFK